MKYVIIVRLETPYVLRWFNTPMKMSSVCIWFHKRSIDAFYNNVFAHTCAWENSIISNEILSTALICVHWESIISIWLLERVGKKKQHCVHYYGFVKFACPHLISIRITKIKYVLRHNTAFIISIQARSKLNYTNPLQQIGWSPFILPLSYTHMQVHSKILINSNQLAGRGSVIIPISTTAGAKP